MQQSGSHLPALGMVLGLGLVVFSLFLAWNVRKLQKTAADYYLAGRNVGVFQNASAICGDYISAASFLGVAGLTFLIGFEGLFYAFGFYLGFLVVLFFIAGPLRRFGQYTIPDFVGGRFHSNTGRALAILCVLVISLFYTAPQMLGSAKILLVLTGIPYAARRRAGVRDHHPLRGPGRDARGDDDADRPVLGALDGHLRGGGYRLDERDVVRQGADGHRGPHGAQRRVPRPDRPGRRD